MRRRDILKRMSSLLDVAAHRREFTMTNQSKQCIASILIEGSIAEEHRIPSDVLTRIIDGFQNIAWNLGAASEDAAYGERSRRISSDLKKKYMIQWGLPKEGSYVLTLYPPVEQKIDTTIMEVLMALGTGSFEKLKKIIPDSRLRSKLLEILKFLPRVGENWLLKYTSKNHSVSLDAKSSQKIKAWFSESLSAPQPDEVLTIKGELLRIDFEAKRVAVRYLPTHRSLDCYYLPEIEDSIVESRRGLIEVTGCFVLDREGHPERLTEVSVIQPVDLSPMNLDQYIQQDRKELRLTRPLIFVPILDEETKQLYVIRNESLNIEVDATTRETLMQNLEDQLVFLWDTYGSDLVDPNTLTKSALRLRQSLREQFEEISN